MTLDELINKTPACLSTDQCDIINTSSFPRTYLNQDGKKVRIQSFFNGSIAAHNRKLYFCCRGDQKPWFQNIRLIFCELDDNFIPRKGTARFLDVGSHLDDKGQQGEFRVEDPRLFICDNKLHISYGDGYDMYHANFHDDITIDRWRKISNFKVKINQNDGREKNWVPFEYGGKPHFIYSDNPRVIWCPFTKTAHLSQQNITWKHGQIRGGTPAIPYKGQLITFFHSAQSLQTWAHGRVYFMGAYTFSKDPPFRVTSMTQVPIMRGERLYKNPIVEKIAVVFPAGAVQSSDSFFVSLGINDACTGVIRIQKFLIDSLLQPVK